jgi:hypothetical protein
MIIFRFFGLFGALIGLLGVEILDGTRATNKTGIFYKNFVLKTKSLEQ